MRTRNILITLISGWLLIAACDKNNNDDTIPYAYINMVIKPNTTMYLELNVVGGWTYLDAPHPSRGIIVYRKALDEFMASERTCPYDPSEPDARVEVETTFSTAVDSCCMSRYLLMDGSPFSGPSNKALLQYHTSYDGVNLYITN